MQIEKMKSTAKFMNTGAKVVGGIFGACAIVCAVFAVLALVLWQETVMTDAFTLDLGYLTLHLADGNPVDMEVMKWFACVGLVGSSVVCFLVSRGARHLRAILTPMEEGRPFEPGTPGSLRKIAWLTLIGGAVTQVLGFAEGMLLTRACPMDAILSAAAVEKYEYNYTMDFSFVWVVCFILFLSYIFSYGQKLQQESDETL